MSKIKRFSCTECGTPFEAYPPDDLHPTASLESPKEAEGNVVKMTYDCQNPDCRHPTVLYWYRPKMHIAVG